MQKLGVARGRMVELTAAAGELASRAKLRVARSKRPSVASFLAIESLATGVEAKRRLWLSLEHAEPDEVTKRRQQRASGE